MSQVYVSSETNSRVPPTFSGVGFSLDEEPLKFIEDFQEAAGWNNWVDSRKKELFRRCLKGFAANWYTTVVMESAAYDTLEFSSSSKSRETIVSLFKAKFVTSTFG
ncbi:hypothetical protein [Parasitella parasitica]|uniref:Retrotransposon gag domain-containing protein n=1 Tax=Parasitella parasitica TaxID=35722 RepID=A0A0B7MPU2_9FUNG|nr:hypothetical protein [Parasitella parasitica]